MSMFNHVLHALERAEEDLVDVIETRAREDLLDRGMGDWKHSNSRDSARHQQTLGAVRKAIHIMGDAGFVSDKLDELRREKENDR